MIPVPAVIVTGLGAAVAGAGFWLHKTGKLAGLFKQKNQVGPSPSPSAKPSTPSTPSVPQTPAIPSVPKFIEPPTPTEVEKVREVGKAAAAAKVLYEFLKRNGVTNETAEMKALVLAFQKAHNSDKDAKQLGGQISEDGLYGPGTSGALTVYTQDPIPGNPKYQPRAATLGEALTNRYIGEGGSNAGTAFRSQYNLVEYLKKHGLTNNGTQQALVRQLQLDVNTDPLFPGPAYKPSPKPPIVHDKMSVDGLLGPKTKGVLLFNSSDEDFPLIAKALKNIGNDAKYMDLLRKTNRPVALI